MKIHKLKIKKEFAELHYKRCKDWELRENDRDFKAGDSIEFTIIETGFIYIREIKYVFKENQYGLQNNYVILSIEKA